MNTMSEDQQDFMLAGNQVTALNSNQKLLYANLITEEYEELMYALDQETESNQLKEAADLLVVTLGFMWSYGINPQDVWNLVHANNMAKVSDTVVKDENGKIMKSPESKARKEKMMESIKELLNVCNS